MVLALSLSPPVKGKPPKLNMLELVTEVDSRYSEHKIFNFRFHPWFSVCVMSQTVVLQRAWSLYDVRREQRRVAALIFGDSLDERLKFPLRRRLLPQAYCYVCSRIDPSGIFRNPNSYLFRRGFFQACEHFPKAPYTTFVKDDENHNHEEDRGIAEYDTIAAPSISVTIKQSSAPASQYGSSQRRGRTRGSRSEKRRSSLADDGQRLSESVPRLPPLTPQTPQSRILKTSRTAKSHDKLADIITRMSGQPESADYLAEEVTPSVTVIPYGEDFSESQSKITELSAFTKGTTPTKSTNDLDSKLTLSNVVTSSNTGRMNPNLDNVLQTQPYINESDGLDDLYASGPFVRDSASLDSNYGNRAKRPKAGRTRDKGNTNASDAGSSTRPESGHLRYHHRLEDDSVPYMGFEIPPTPSTELSLSLATSEMGRHSNQRRRVQQRIADGDVFAGSSTGVPGSSVSDDTLRFSELTRSKNKSRKTKMGSGVSGKKGYCRCSSAERGHSGIDSNICSNCGKPFRHAGSACSRGSSIAFSDGYEGPPPSQGSVKTKSRQKMLDSHGRRLQTATDEDYMDLDSIIHEDDGHYFSSDEDDDLTYHFDDSPETYDRYRKLRGQQLVDPDLHKIVYLRALREAQMRKAQNLPSDSNGCDFEHARNIRRPHVFSYFQVWPHVEKRHEEPIGLRQPEPIKVKKGQFMKHIFGDVNMDDFYPKQSKGKPTVSKRTSGQTRRVLPEVPKPKKVASSYSLKLSRSDIRFDDN